MFHLGWPTPCEGGDRSHEEPESPTYLSTVSGHRDLHPDIYGVGGKGISNVLCESKYKLKINFWGSPLPQNLIWIIIIIMENKTMLSLSTYFKWYWLLCLSNDLK